MVGVVLFSIAFAYIAQTSIQREGDTSKAVGANQDARATALAKTLLGSGSGWYSGSACTTSGGKTTLDPTAFSPDLVAATSGGVPVGRFGLGEEPCLRSALGPAPGTNLSYAKLVNLYSAAMASNPSNGRVDYQEARTSLGLTAQGLDFHLRAYPVLPSVDEMLRTAYKDPYMRPLYIGDYAETSQPSRVVQRSSSVSDQADRVVVTLTVTNNGTAATIFATLFEVPLSKNNVDFTLSTPLLAPGESYALQFTLLKSQDWVWKDPAKKWVSFNIQDKDGTLGSGTISLASTTMTSGVNRVNVVAEADRMYWIKSGASPVTTKLYYFSFLGDGSKVKFSDWTLVAVDPLGVPMAPIVLPNNVFSGSVSPVATLSGAYSGQVKNDLLTAIWNVDRLNVVPTEISAFTATSASAYEPAASVAVEAGFVDLLVNDFDANVYSALYGSAAMPYLAGGDVYPDLKNVMNADLVTALTDASGAPSYSKYNVVFVGSNVDQAVMTSASAKYAIRDWVLGGGTLIVFGSDKQNVQWLQPLFHASLETANGALYTPDAQHPVLRVPNALDYSAYQYTTDWSYTAGSDAFFEHVVQAGSSGDVLGVSNAGAFGDGRVALTSWRPYSLTADQSSRCAAPITPKSQCQSLFLIDNLVTLSYRYLYLDYGPAVPIDAATGSVFRIANVYHPELRDSVALHLEVYVFGN